MILPDGKIVLPTEHSGSTGKDTGESALPHLQVLLTQADVTALSLF